MPNYVCTNPRCNKPFNNQRFAPKRCDKCNSPVQLATAVTGPPPLAALKWTSHKNKHVPPNLPVAKIQDGTKHDEAKYHPNTAIQRLETAALAALHNTPGIVETGTMIGWFKGKESTKVEIYVGAENTFHGHPINDDMARQRGGVGATINTW